VKPFLAAVLLLCTIASGAPQTPPDGVERVDDLVRQVSQSLSNLPGDLRRLAFYQLKADRAEISPSFVRHIQARLEATFRDPGDRTLVSAPELKTLRIVSTDTSLSIANTEASVEDLWKLGDKLRVDAFVDGTLARDAEGNILLSLRLFRSRDGEVVWTGNWVAGPGKPSGLLADMKFGVQIPLRLFPIDKYRADGIAYTGGKMVTDIGLEGFAIENISQDGRFFLTLSAGYSHHTLIGLPDSVEWSPSMHMLRGGAEIEAMILRKDDPRDGYWIGTYFGVSEALPMMYRDHLTILSAGYRSQITRHLALSGGFLFLPLTTDLVGTYGNDGVTLQFDRIAYEAIFLRFTF